MGTKQMKRFPSIEEGIDFFKHDPLLFEPGAYYLYSTYAISLSQGLVETVRGEGFEDDLRSSIWETAGMTATSFDVPEMIVPGRRPAPGNPLPAGAGLAGSHRLPWSHFLFP